MLLPVAYSASAVVYRGVDDVDLRIVSAETYAEAMTSARADVQDDYYVSKVVQLGRGEYAIIARKRLA